MSTQMSFADASAAIKDGDAIFIHRRPGFHGFKSVYGLLINLFTGSSIYHTVVAMWLTTGSGEKILMAVESTGSGGKRIVPLWIYNQYSMEVMPLLAPHQFADMESLALTAVGTESYGWLDAISIGVKEFTGIQLGKFPNQVCSQLTADLWRAAGVPIADDFVSPGKLYNELLKSGASAVSITV